MKSIGILIVIIIIMMEKKCFEICDGRNKDRKIKENVFLF